MINFNKDSIFNLKPIKVSAVRREVDLLLAENEEIICAFRTVRDQLVFTDMRIICIDIQSISGTRKSFTSLPYNKVHYFTVQTPSIAELVPDSELILYFANGFKATFEFRGSTDIFEIGQIISENVLG